MMISFGEMKRVKNAAHQARLGHCYDKP